MQRTLTAAVHSALSIRNSRFLGCIEPMSDRASARARVAALRAAHANATHVCWALLAGGQSAAVDDGEPNGTAGRPMLDVLRHHNLEGVLATVVRYFGGVKLGAGGLARAYAATVSCALRGAVMAPLQRRVTLACGVPYACEGLLRRHLAEAGATLLDAAHGERARLRFVLPESEVAALVARVNELTQGRASWLELPDPPSTGGAAA